MFDTALTLKDGLSYYFCWVKIETELKHLKIIAFTHKQIELKELGKLVICQENLSDKLRRVQSQFDIPEMFY